MPELRHLKENINLSQTSVEEKRNQHLEGKLR